MMFHKFHVAVYKESDKKFVIVAGYDDINDVVRDYGNEVLTRGVKRVMILQLLDTDVKVNVTLLNNE